ncbi:hypothetical protein [Acidisoma silvae]|uniref:Uncharacterized protein n=1 Tax=Acidisoma silvae TaxID=2802396 RepID=A0A963YWH6_9PROT|nr:hypothetical protein [Acidisoma silvae]MCB8877595.1 hypothetical protein [Acidisoma silvae]
MMRVSELLALPDDAANFWLDVERQAVTEALNKALDHRASLLLQDETDEMIAASDAEMDRLHLTLERLDAVETARSNSPPLS